MKRFVAILFVMITLTGCSSNSLDSSNKIDTQNNNSIEIINESNPPCITYTTYEERFDTYCSIEFRDLVHIDEVSFENNKNSDSIISIVYKIYDEVSANDCGNIVRYSIESISSIINYEEDTINDLVIEILFNTFDGNTKYKFISNYERSTSGDYINYGYTEDDVNYIDGYFSTSDVSYLATLLDKEWCYCDDMLQGYLGNSITGNGISAVRSVYDPGWNISAKGVNPLNDVHRVCITYDPRVTGETIPVDEISSMYLDIMDAALEVANSSGFNPEDSRYVIVTIKYLVIPNYEYVDYNKSVTLKYDYESRKFK